MISRAAALLDKELTTLRVLASSGIIRPYSPAVLVKMAKALKQWGTGPAGGFTALALRAPDDVGIIDELGELTFAELHQRSNALADSLRRRGVDAGDGMAIMCRNHRGFVEASIAGAKLGADLLYLNTAFAGPQLAEVLEREGPTVVVHDEEFTDLLTGSGEPKAERILAWTDSDDADQATLAALIEQGSPADRPPVERPSRVVILTSGTTGTPKGAPRSEAGIENAVSMLSRIPLRRGWRTHIAAPLFHTWGWAHLALSMLLGSTIVLRRKFEPQACLEAVTEHRCDSLVVIPVMLQRILQLPDEVLDAHDFTQVKVVAASGSALPGDLATEWMDRFGDTLYNTYGSTEVAYATIATPRDLREAPGSAGKPPWGAEVRILDEQGQPVPGGEPGRIFVRNTMLFEGYTGGGNKDVVDGLMATGDVGRLDPAGHLFVEGRDDEMIVSGGENVFPQEVEDCLTRHDAVVEAAAIGVEDEEFGKRLRAFVVLTEDGAADEEQLKGWVKSNLARYKVPREIVFLDELPRNATGKILKRELAERE